MPFNVPFELLIALAVAIIGGVQKLLEWMNRRRLERLGEWPEDEPEDPDLFSELEAELNRRFENQNDQDSSSPPPRPVEQSSPPHIPPEPMSWEMRNIPPPIPSTPQSLQAPPGNSQPSPHPPIRFNQTKQVEKPKLTPKEKRALEEIEHRKRLALRRQRSTQSTYSTPRRYIRQHFRSPNNVKKAILLSEVISPPLALRTDQDKFS